MNPLSSALCCPPYTFVNEFLLVWLGASCDLISVFGMYCTVCVSAYVSWWGCPVQLFSDPSFLLALFKPKLHGAAYGKGIYLSPISSISFGYSGRNGSLLATLRLLWPRPSHLLLSIMLVDMALCAACVMAWSSWNTSFSHMGDFNATLPCCTVSCVHLKCWASEFVLTYHTVLCVVALRHGGVSKFCVVFLLLADFCGVGFLSHLK